MPVSSDLIERMHYKRRSSFVHEQRHKASENLEEVEVDIAEGTSKPSPRRKSASVCVSMITMKPEANLVHYQRPRQTTTVQRNVGKSRFTVEKNCQPFNIQELQSVRLRGLSTSEVFHEPPKMYVYRERPAPYVYHNTRRKKWLVEFVKKRKHTICAWSFGIFALALMTTVIVLQSEGDF